MVNLLLGSGVDQSRFPNIHNWDAVVRKHFDKYQRLIDAHTYRLQRIQRGLLALPYPRFYNTELLTLQVLKRKQEVGEVDKHQLDLYKTIDPCIGTHFNRTFGTGWSLPVLGAGVGGGFFAFSTYFNFSFPTRIVLSAVPVVIDWLRITRDPINEQHSLNFLNWVVGYRKAKCFIERHRKEFENPEARKVFKHGNIVELGHELIALAGK